MAKCLDRLRAKRRIATLANRKKITTARKLDKIVGSVKIENKQIQEYLSGNVGLIGSFVGEAVKTFTSKYNVLPSMKAARAINAMIENFLESNREAEPTVSFSELRADENRATSRTKARRTISSKFRTATSLPKYGKKIEGKKQRIPRKEKKAITTLLHKQQDSVRHAFHAN